MNNKVIWPLYSEDPMVTGDTVLAMMENNALRHATVGTVFQLYGATPLFSRQFRTFLDRNFPHHWIGRGGPIPWPPRSPDFTRLDSFFSVFVQHAVYREEVQNVNELCVQNPQIYQ
jgi:hypothetical protein